MRQRLLPAIWPPLSLCNRSIARRYAVPPALCHLRRMLDADGSGAVEFDEFLGWWRLKSVQERRDVVETLQVRRT
eukprot:SAG11_NODE_2091_length_3842_cov_1.651349_4_plen_75_part_00